jgi:Avidin family
MKQRPHFVILISCLVIAVCASQRSDTRDVSSQIKFLGKWTNQNEAKGPAIINITSIDSATGQLRGKYYPPSGAAAGQEFDLVGWLSSAAPVANRDNVLVISFSVSLRTYGSIATWTGFLKENKIVASSANVRSNSGYEWDHITATYDVWTKNP